MFAKEEKYYGKMSNKTKPPFKSLLFLIILLLIPLIAHSEPLDQTIDGLQTYLSSTKDFSGSFLQETVLKSFNEKQKAEGKVFFMKPGKMKWEYMKPELQTILISNKMVWIFTPEENQVIQTRIDELGTSAIYDLFLSNKIKINKLFDPLVIKEKESFQKPVLFLELIPKNLEVNIKKIILELNKTSYQIKSFILFDKLDNITTIKFTNIQRNQGLKASIFDIKIPEGVELIRP